jgi:hypothetical protein
MSLGNAMKISQFPKRGINKYKAHEKEDPGLLAADRGCHLSATATTSL